MLPKTLYQARTADRSFDLMMAIVTAFGTLAFICSSLMVHPAQSNSVFYKADAGLLEESWPTTLPYTLNSMTAIPGYPNCPTTLENKDKFEWNQTPNTSEIFHKRFRSYFISPASGTYRFFIVCNENCAVNIELQPGTIESFNHSSNSSIGWSSRKWSKDLELQKGFRYKIEANYSGGTKQPSFIKLGVRLPNGTELKPLDKRVLRRSMDLYAANRLFTERFDDIHFPSSEQSFRSFMQIPSNAIKYPSNPSASICSPLGFMKIYSRPHAWRYSGYFKPSKTGNFTFRLLCDSFCEMNLTKDDNTSVTLAADYGLNEKIDAGALQKDHYYKMELFLAANSRIYLFLYKKIGHESWNPASTDNLVNLKPAESSSYIPAPTLAVINRTAISVTINRPYLPPGDKWMYQPLCDIVFYKSSAIQSETSLTVRGTLPLNTVVENLKGNTTYTFYLKYYGYVEAKRELNLISKKETIKTDEAVPTAAPKSFKAKETAVEAITLSWDEIPKEHRNGIITGYNIMLKKKSSSIWKKVKVLRDHTSWIIDALLPDTGYEFKIAGKTSDGIGTYSNMITAKTDNIQQPITQIFPTAYLTNILFTGKRFVGHVSKTMLVKSVERCFMVCLECIQTKSTCHCSSFNIKRPPSKSSSSFACEINNSNHRAIPSDLVEGAEYQYYEVM